MIISWKNWGSKLALYSCLIVALALALRTNRASAQITPDGTLPNNSRVTTQDNIRTIEGGTIAGGNLFHSFQEFSVPAGATAFFNNAADIQNIISRVTGKSISNIDGLIQANGRANLFLINPSGIIFGKNAELNIGGSFLASTANSLKFADGTVFSAAVQTTTPLLTISVPIGLQFGGNAQSIVNQSRATDSNNLETGLKVRSGNTLALVGGDVKLDGGILQAPGGRVELGGVSETATVGLNFSDNNLSLSFPDSAARADVSLTDGALINVAAGGGGSIVVNARNLNILGGTRLIAGIGEGNGSVGSQGGDITLNALDAITIGNSSSIENMVASDATGNDGDINIKAGSLLLTDVAKLSTNNIGQGDAGNISVQSNGDVSVEDISSIYSTVTNGNAGSISVQSNGNVSFSRSFINTNSIVGQGNAGSISVQANGSASFSNTSISTYAQEGNAGSISVRANGNLSNTLNAGKAGNIINFKNNQISTSTYSKGNAGNILVQANGNIDFIDNDISTKTSPKGDAGNISIQANGNIFFKENGISTGSLLLDSRIFSGNIIPAEGNIGNISVQANGNINFESNTITSNTSNKADAGKILLQANGNIDSTFNFIFSYTDNKGNAGNISVQAGGNVSSKDDTVLSNTVSKGDAGNISVQADGNVSFASGSISSASGGGGLSREERFQVEGKGGDIFIQSRSLWVTDGARVFATTYGKGDAGNIQVEALDSVTVSGINANYGFSSGLFTNTEEGASRTGGDIKIQTRDLRILDGAVLNARTRSDFDGGNITVDVKTLEVTGGGQMLTTAFSSGNAGKITVNAASSISLSGSNPTYADQLAQSGEDELYPTSALSGIFSDTNPDSTGKGGIIEVNAGRLNVYNGAQVSVSSAGSGDAGSLRVNANSIKLDSIGKLVGTTASGRGGDIKLDVRDLILMRNNSAITTTAANNGSGGNITINTPDGFIVAVPSENSNILANAFQGSGGQIKINATGIYGLENRTNLPEDSKISEISASSEFGVNGTVQINTPNIDPNNGLVNLPAIPVDTSFAQTCTAGGNVAKSEFIITGRGGLSSNPNQALSTDAVQVDLVTLNPKVDKRSTSISTTPTTPTPPTIVEATAWMIDKHGNVVLTANAPTAEPNSSWQKTVDCQKPGS